MLTEMDFRQQLRCSNSKLCMSLMGHKRATVTQVNHFLCQLSSARGIAPLNVELAKEALPALSH